MFASRFYGDRYFAPSYWGKGSVAAVEVPDVAGDDQAPGTTELEGAGFVVAVATEYSSLVVAGVIISQSPVGGSFAVPGSTVTITVSLGEAPQPPQNDATGGWWPQYDHVRTLREQRRREIEEAEAEAQLVQDEIDRQIYLAQRKREAEEAEAADLKRLQALADQFAGKKLGLPKKVEIAILNAQDARSRNALEQMRREIEQMLESEMLAIQQIVLLMADD